MTDERPVSLNEDLLDRVDESRGNLSRTEFIERCVIDRLLGLRPRLETAREEPDRGTYATRKELLEFTQETKDSFQRLIDAFIEFSSPPGGGRQASHALDDEKRQKEYQMSGPERREHYYEEDERDKRDYDQRDYYREREEPTRYRWPPSDYAPSESPDDSGYYDSGYYREPADHSEERYPPASEDHASKDYIDLPQTLRNLARQVKHRLSSLLSDNKTQPSKTSRDNRIFREEHDRAYHEEYDRPNHEPAHRAREDYRDYREGDSYRTYHEGYGEAAPRRDREVRRREEVKLSNNHEARADEDVNPVEEKSNQNMYFGIWILAILLFGFGDTLLSTMVFAKGGYEVNPLMGGLVSMLGGSLVAFVFVKTAVLIALAIISFKFFKNIGWLIPSILCAIGVFLTLSNLIVYLKLP